MGGNAESGVIGGLGQDLATAVARHAESTNAYRVWTAARDTATLVPDVSTQSHAERMAPLLKHVAGVRQKLFQTLMAQTRSHWTPDAEDGALNPHALHRLASVHELRRRGERHHAEALSRWVFRKKIVAKRLKTAVTLLVDLSHSMCGRKLNLARDTALVLCEALSRLNIPTAVWGFSTAIHGSRLKDASRTTGIPEGDLEKVYRFAPLLHECFMRFDEPFRKVGGRFASMEAHMLTPLGESMLFAARELSRRPEPRKVLLALTDGRPTVGMGDETTTFQHARDSIVRIEKAGIDVALVGMFEPCVRDLHHRAVVVDTLDDLPRTVMGQLQALLTTRIHARINPAA
jgi:cobalamin biosynthesis protein CobT